MLSKAIAPKRQHLLQAAKFISIGMLNTAIDFLVLNLLILLFGTGSHGELYAVFKAISFASAVVNSYVFNKYWVFKHDGGESRLREGFLFFLVSGIGFLLNVSISTASFIFISVHTSLSGALSANIGAVIGSVLVLAWNFAGYKLIVFKK